jgi:hypothetical protein
MLSGVFSRFRVGWFGLCGVIQILPLTLVLMFSLVGIAGAHQRQAHHVRASNPIHIAHRAKSLRPPVATVTAIVAPRGPWPTWRNTIPYGAPASSGIADCAFAATADWELMMFGHAPSEAQLIQEFHAAGGANAEGIEQGPWEHWLLKHGIGGIHVRLIERPSSWLDALIQIHHAVLANLVNHIVVVAGFNSTGPEIITYGETRQETWAAWRTYEPEVYVPLIVR